MTVENENGNIFASGSFNQPLPGHRSFDFTAAPLSGEFLTLTVDTSTLGNVSDDIGLDNIRFGQSTTTTNPPIPLPASRPLLLAGLGGLGLMRRRSKRV